jgi:hypothetical protein
MLFRLQKTLLIAFEPDSELIRIETNAFSFGSSVAVVAVVVAVAVVVVVVRKLRPRKICN